MRKYTLYAIGEIALVVIGILIALQINNWNEDRLIKKEIADSFVKLQNDLSIDLTRFDLLISDLEEFLDNAKNIKELLPKENNLQDLIRIKKLRLGQRNIDYVSDSYQSMISTGIFYKTKHPKLQSRITEYYRILKDCEEIISRANLSIISAKSQEALIPFLFIKSTKDDVLEEDLKLYAWVDDRSSLTYQGTQNFLADYRDWYSYILNEMIKLKILNEDLFKDIEGSFEK
jgi:hypothetical protein